jgi:hypothetical protein
MPKTILKLTDHDEQKEIEFELEYLASLSITERFQLMFQRSIELLTLLEKNGHRKTPAIIKRS